MSVGPGGALIVTGSADLSGTSSVSAVGGDITLQGGLTGDNLTVNADPSASFVATSLNATGSLTFGKVSGGLEIGGAGHLAPDSLHIDAGANVSALDLNLSAYFVNIQEGNTGASVVNDGTISIAAGGRFDVSNIIEGTGQIDMGAGSVIEFFQTGQLVPFNNEQYYLYQNATTTNAISLSGGGDVTIDLDTFNTFNTSTATTSYTTASLSGAVTGFDATDKIVVGTAVDSATWTNNLLTLSDNGKVVSTVDLVGNYSGDTFNITDEAGGATQITVICFMPGTLVRTPLGDQAVENLKIGDLVSTAPGGAQPVKWVGRQTVSTRFSDPLRVLPIRISKGSLGENLPERDLLVSPDHALFLDGVLVQAGALVNGQSITRETGAPEVFTYFHVELWDHSLILAHGVPAETFIDNVDRMAFDNWTEHEALYGDHAPLVEMPHPRAKSHRQVPQKLRKALAERAALSASVREGAA